MVAYSFKKQFADIVESGKKLHTIRAPRKNGHAKPGQNLQLYTGMRTKVCRKLVAVDPICWDVFDIKIDAETQLIWINNSKLSPDQDWQLIKGDGFNRTEDFWEFFKEPVEGMSLICWVRIEWLKVFRETENAYSPRS